MTFAYDAPDEFVNLDTFPDGFEYAFTATPYESSMIPTYGSPDQNCLPLNQFRHYPNDTYQIESQLRQNSHHQSQSRHSSTSSYNMQPWYANSMNISNPNSLSNTNRHTQATKLSYTPSGSTDNSVSSATATLNKTRHHSTDTQTQQSSSPPNNGQRIYCTHLECLDPSTGTAQHSFTRKADLQRN